MAGGVEPVRYPYSVAGKIKLFPFRFHWKNGRFVRYLSYALLATLPVIYKIHSGVHSPGNVRQWDQIRKNREHTHFDPPH
ncbi:uncharacterized protein [Haliotis cracherodii]|uniref:uncharacterized protein n=1 Tax=Haliotis cracherodii TaxID=6455 RepID=UPI0039E973D4